VKRTRLAVAGIAVAALGLLGCTSNPSTKAVAKDIAQSIDLPKAQQDCLLRIIDEMSDDELKKLGADNEGATFTAEGGGNKAMQAFIDEMQTKCPPDVTAPPEGGSTPSEESTPDTTTADSTAAATTTTLG
jgi:hypothetical protein